MVSSRAAGVEIMEGFPKSITGRGLWLPLDNLNTDGIYSGKLTYRDDVSEAEMAAASMANYDPEFDGICKTGDIIVSGRNFGTGSSREQAATCLKLRGIPCVIAWSFSETYKRNAFNNAFLVLECPELVEHLEAGYEDSNAATIVGPNLAINFASSIISGDEQEFSFAPLSAVAQELIVAGGAEALVKRRLVATN